MTAKNPAPESELIDRARQMIEQAGSISSFSGAGLSAESGVATFRDKNPDALWAKYDPMQLASPDGFRSDPNVVMEWYAWRRKQIGEAEPNPAHEALAKHTGIVNSTQNTDNLLERAGARNVVHLHGEIVRDRCDHPSCAYKEELDLKNPPGLRNCPSCGEAYMRPDVVWFGEMLPTDAWSTAEAACGSCDVLLVVGTSAAVYPAAGLISLAKSAGANVIVVNKESSGASQLADIELIGQAGEVVPQILV